ncbi:MULTISPECIES: hypothetical protein [unclassified Breznakia]|uniref:LiaF transmembrane domain-containing protein n=1 Tax=unclassified Breznakia TaxID=2623764 RepID=UPI00247667E5|nr:MULTISPECIES: hypothetical protein [unclassified Breznakia]MDH6367121.1 hypothetical protein [Breznakia sp. PH1-1]MDH6404292.1 hypothetical protein [Breznakia sp. PF1-11]MDH6412008.1 hypothetical protein [Breznakia sp. PFB1-11]MDH6414280.1 hypothetical protein [Breznakia sp. PFB1-14]MDH6416622.1 hypothetical protein [Breznakia sp. PFB1-4]
MNKKTNWLWGIVFIAVGVMIVLVPMLGLSINLMHMIWTVLLLLCVVSNIKYRNWFLIVMPLCLAVWINRSYLQIEDVLSFFPLMGAGVFVSIGLSIIFKDHSYRYNHIRYHRSGKHADYTKQSSHDESVINIDTALSGSAQYIHSQNLRLITAEVSLGSLQLYLQQAKLDPEGATIKLDVSLATLTLYIPKEWNTQVDVSSSLGGVDEGFHERDYNLPKLLITGEVSLGNLEIIYI